MIHVAALLDDRQSRLAARIGIYLSQQTGQQVSVTNIGRLAGGTSHATWSVDTQAADGQTLSLVLRQDFEDAPIENDLRFEFTLLTALHEAGQPVPQPLWAAFDSSALPTPFMISARVIGADVRKVIARGAVDDRAQLAHRLVELQGNFHKLDWRTIPAVAVAHDGSCAHREVERWAAVIEGRKQRAGPLAIAAVNWLRAHTPDDPAELALVHGDYKTNNILFDGSQHFITDWELAHIGDPIEDIAWTMLWTTTHDLVGGLLSPQDYVATYERCVGYRVDPERLAFWQLFSLVKLTAIFLTGAVPSEHDVAVRPTLGILGRGASALEAAMPTGFATCCPAVRHDSQRFRGAGNREGISCRRSRAGPSGSYRDRSEGRRQTARHTRPGTVRASPHIAERDRRNACALLAGRDSALGAADVRRTRRSRRHVGGAEYRRSRQRRFASSACHIRASPRNVCRPGHAAAVQIVLKGYG